MKLFTRLLFSLSSLNLFIFSFFLQSSANATSDSAASTAVASSAAQNAQSPFLAFLPFILIFVVFYFLMLRPQKKRMQQEENMLASLSSGDEVFTKSGILGKIAGLTDSVVTLQISENVYIKILRSQVGGLSKKLFEQEKKDKK